MVIGIVDDHTRLAYCELHASENADNVSACLRRGAAWMCEQGCGPLEAVSSFLRFYNRRRPNSAANGRPPISRVHDVGEQDI